MKEDAWRNDRKTSLEKYSPLSLFVRFAFKRMLETEHKLHILTPLLWPLRCVFIVLLMLGSTPSGLSEGPLGRVWPSIPHLISNPLGVCWHLHRGFPRSPSVGCGLPFPHLVSNPLGVCWQLHSGFSECPLGRVWPSLPHLISTVWNSTGNRSGAQTQLS